MPLTNNSETELNRESAWITSEDCRVQFNATIMMSPLLPSSYVRLAGKCVHVSLCRSCNMDNTIVNTLDKLRRNDLCFIIEGDENGISVSHLTFEGYTPSDYLKERRDHANS